jgi:hypothetical protein
VEGSCVSTGLFFVTMAKLGRAMASELCYLYGKTTVIGFFSLTKKSLIGNKPVYQNLQQHVKTVAM